MLAKTRLGLGLGLTLLSTQVLASSTSPNAALPYESWLLTLQQSFTGPVAMSVALLGMVAAGSSLIFLGGEMGRFIRTLIYLVMVMALLLGSNSLISNFFNGAVVISPEQLTETAPTYVDPQVQEELCSKQQSAPDYFERLRRTELKLCTHEQLQLIG
ncbi:MAG: TrbC/VirB2 family protein [Succinivibrio sp.]|nr:TrbC/VirB2 family protein [Succinivibrio sp.]